MKIAILGAQRTGKTQLTQALSVQLQPQYPDVTCLPDCLQLWGQAQGRQPQAAELSVIAAEHQRQTDTQTEEHMPLVLCDSAPLMAAVYSDLLYGDTSLYASAIAHHKRFGMTLVTGLDLANTGTDSPIGSATVCAREQVTRRLRDTLQQHGITYSMVYGTGKARTESALQAILYAMGKPRSSVPRSNWQWPCEKCSDPDCEHRLFVDLIKGG